MSEKTSQAIRQLLEVVGSLRQAYPKKRFTLDGRLVGDLGEAIAEEMYDLTTFEQLEKHHDAMTPDGRLVQIKVTMQNALTFPADHVPDFYLGLHILEDGSAVEVFNGPGRVAWQTVRNRKRPKTNLHSVSLHALRALNQDVKDEDRIRRRP